MSATIQRLTAIIETQSAIAQAGLDFAEVLKIVVARTKKMTPASAAIVEIIDGDHMIYKAASGTAEPSLGLRMPRAGSLSGLCVESRRVQVCEDSEEDDRVNREACRRVGLRSMLIVPLEHEDTVIGVLKVCSPEPRAFTPEHEEILRLVAGFIGVSMGLSAAFKEKNEALQRATENEEQYKFLTNAVPTIIWTATADGVNNYLSSRWTEYTGVPVEETLKSGWSDVIHPEDMTGKREYWKETVSSGRDWKTEFRVRGQDGVYKWFLSQASPLRNSSGNIIKWFGTLTNIEDKHAYEEELRAATLSKSQFLANMSHEIRTPLTSIIGFSEAVLIDDMSRAESTAALNSILRNGKHLLRIINDILDLSKIEAGKIDLEIIPVSFFGLLSDVDNLMNARAVEEGISFEIEYQYPLPRTIQSDPTRLKQILINLCGNAVKFTKKGGVKVKVSYDREAQKISYAVVDTGIGLTNEQQGRLFSAFSQADASTTRKFGGTGLGLAVSKQLAEKLGGIITLESLVDCGSTFTLTVPAGRVMDGDIVYFETDKKCKPNEDARSHSGRLLGHILLVEDGPDNQQYLSLLFKKWNLNFTLVENGALCLEAVEKNKFDLVLMDMQMPVMDGYTATRKLRESGFKQPIIALTANVMKSDVKKCLDAGCTAYLGKPFERKDLFEKLEGFLKHISQDQEATSDYIYSEIDDEDELPLIMGFVQTLPSRLAEMCAALESKDWSIVGMLAHRLRGAHMLGYPVLGEAAATVECAVSASDYKQASDNVIKLQKICNKIVQGAQSRR